MNRKALFSVGLLSALCVTPVYAGIIDTGKIMPCNHYDSELINPRFLKGDTPQLVLVDYEEETGVYSFTIYDAKLNEIAHVSSEEYPEVTAVRKKSRWLYGPTGIKEEYSYNTLVSNTYTEEEFLNHAISEGYTRRVDKDGEIRMCYDGDDKYFYNQAYYEYELYGTKYPARYYGYKDNVSYVSEVTYSYEKWDVIGYGTPHEETISRRPSVESLYGRSAECGDMDNIRITQTLFNQDDDYEWVIPIYTAIPVNEENEYEKIEGEDVRCTGFKVVSHTGATVAEINFPSGYVAAYSDLELGVAILGEYTYLSASVRDADGDYYDIIYSVSDGSSVKQVGAPKKVSVYPRTPKRGAAVTVSFDNEVSSGCKLSVVSASGAVIMSRNIPAGMNSVEIDTSNMASGMYIVNVNDGNTVREAAKIIVR